MHMPCYMYKTQCQFKILLSPCDAHLITWNQTVNHQGDKDTNFPNDHDMEHQSLALKTEVKTYRGTFTEQTLKHVSQSAQATDAICKNFDNVPWCSDDLTKLWICLPTSWVSVDHRNAYILLTQTFFIHFNIQLWKIGWSLLSNNLKGNNITSIKLELLQQIMHRIWLY